MALAVAGAGAASTIICELRRETGEVTLLYREAGRQGGTPGHQY